MQRRTHLEGLGRKNERGEERDFVDPNHSGDRPVLDDPDNARVSLRSSLQHCYTASSRTDRLEQIVFSELKPLLEDAARFGLQKIYFTGGEVFVNEDVLRGRLKTTRRFETLIRRSSRP